MKTIFFFLAFLFIVSTPLSYAHEQHNKDTSQISQSSKESQLLMEKEMFEHQQMEAVKAFPNYHPLIVHFPIVLLIMAAVFQLLSFFFFKNQFSIATLFLLFLGVLTAWLSSNPLHAMPGELYGKAKEIFETHERMAAYTWWLSLIALIIKFSSQFVLKRKLWTELTATLFLIASAVTVSIAGHHGSMLVHMEGIGPMGKYLDGYKIKASEDVNTKEITDSINEQKEDGAGNDDHHVGEPGKGPLSGTIQEAEPNHIEIVKNGRDLIFYLLDGNATPINMNTVSGEVEVDYLGNKKIIIDLMMMDGKLTAMDAVNGKDFNITCRLKKGNQTYSAHFDSKKDLIKK